MLKRLKQKKSLLNVVYIILFTTILFFAFFPRAIEMLAGNFLFGYDQGKHWLAAKSIVVDHKIALIGDEVGGGGGFFQGPGWFYLLSIPFFFWSGDPQGSIVLMVLMGIITIALSFLFTKHLGRRTTLFIAFLLAVSPSIIAQSRFAWPPFIIPPLTILYLYFTYLSLNRNFNFFYVVFFICGLMAHFEIATALTIFPPTLLFFIIFFLIEKKFSWKKIFAPFSYLVAFLPLFVFDIRHNFLNLHGILNMFSMSSKTSIDFLYAGKHSVIFLINLFGTFEAFPINKWFFVAIFIFITILIIFDKKIHRNKKKFIVFLALFPLVLYLELLFFKKQLWGWWILELPILYIVLVSICLSYIWNKHLVGKIFVAALCLFFLVNCIKNTIQYYKTDYYDLGGTQKIKGRVQALEYIFNDAKNKQFNMLIFAPPVYTYPYDFLIWRLGTTKYDYIPEYKKEGTFYLLIEPDSAKPWTYKGWIETVVKPGNPQWVKTLDSGFIIQKYQE